ncbi:phosphoadenosine phosphosulfate reductase family protein [Campylobacter sputorum]|uniref:phosphoadenosine phosphosulfate reductase domain-containing protein n=1 Tax=Campylobacter sputorum TaxID=206 RepID=UPI00053BE92E|nr:phosphoadenosine phosphosulfate reductase family protein [Campylobacter sputorum]
MTYIASISGGKDSTAMTDLLLKHNYPVDYIIFNDTLAEFPEMYKYIDKLDSYFQRKYGKKITRLKPMKPHYDDVIFARVKKKTSKYYGMIKGIFSPVMGFCEWRTLAKIRPTERYLKSLGIKDYKTYIGYTTTETGRLNREDKTKLYPLVDIFHFNEMDCATYLRKNEMENPLYRKFSRTGCAFCPAHGETGKFYVWKYYPKVWAEMKRIEKRLKELEKGGEQVIYNNWHLGESLEELEAKFIKADKQKSLFDELDPEPLKDCFCKV